MISYLSVRNFKLADRVELEFESGFTTLTGETGAGKSLIIDAVGLLLGDRASPETISNGQDRAEIQGIFQLPEHHAAAAWLKAHDLDAEGECVVRRILTRKSGSRAFINGDAVPVQGLRSLGALVIDVHGQHDQQLLNAPERQRAMLDAFADIETEVDALKNLFWKWQESSAHLEKLKNSSDAERERARLLEFQIGELVELGAQPGEIESLHEEYERLAHAEALLSGVSTSIELLYDADHGSINALLNQINQTLAGLSSHDSELAELNRQLDSISIEVNELAQDLRRKLDSYEHDPERLQSVQYRIDALHSAARKYRVEAEQLPDLLERFETELSGIAADDETISRLEAENAGLEAEFHKQANIISKRRSEAADTLADQVDIELGDLGMPKAHFEIALNPLEQPRAYGLEAPEFRIRTNPGQPLGPLSRVASGGELSRVALSINVVMNRGVDALTQIYDEVDVGIGGGVAEMVGQKLRNLAQAKQVLCVTHLPQVASQAMHHKRVSKAGEDTSAVTIESLADDTRQAEIARMLGGIEITERTLEHAAEMLQRGAGA